MRFCVRRVSRAKVVDGMKLRLVLRERREFKNLMPPTLENVSVEGGLLIYCTDD